MPLPDPSLVGEMLDQIRNDFVAPDAEIAVEANPGSIKKNFKYIWNTGSTD